jgi:hypothetical protein
MKKGKNDYFFWIKYKRFAGNELLLYLVMVVGIIAGIVIVSWFRK